MIGSQNHLRSITLKPRHQWDTEVTAILLCRFVSNSKKFSWRWASKKCQRIDMLRAHSGTSILFSNHRVTQREICTTPSSSRIQRTVSVFQRTIWMPLRKFMKLAASDQRVISMSGRKMRLRRIFCVHIRLLLALKCCTNLLNKRNSSLSNIFR